MSRLRSALRFLPILILGMTVLSPLQASQPISSSTLSRDTAITLLQRDNNPLVIYRDQQTGVPTFWPARCRKSPPRSPPLWRRRARSSPSRPASFRMRAPSQELTLIRDERDRIGMHHVRFQQQYNGVEVFGAVMIAHMRGARIDSVTGTYFPDLSLDTRPSLTFEQGSRWRAPTSARLMLSSPRSAAGWRSTRGTAAAR